MLKANQKWPQWVLMKLEGLTTLCMLQVKDWQRESTGYRKILAASLQIKGGKSSPSLCSKHHAYNHDKQTIFAVSQSVFLIFGESTEPLRCTSKLFFLVMVQSQNKHRHTCCIQQSWKLGPKSSTDKNAKVIQHQMIACTAFIVLAWCMVCACQELADTGPSMYTYKSILWIEYYTNLLDSFTAGTLIMKRGWKKRLSLTSRSFCILV